MIEQNRKDGKPKLAVIIPLALVLLTGAAILLDSDDDSITASTLERSAVSAQQVPATMPPRQAVTTPALGKDLAPSTAREVESKDDDHPWWDEEQDPYAFHEVTIAAGTDDGLIHSSSSGIRTGADEDEAVAEMLGGAYLAEDAPPPGE